MHVLIGNEIIAAVKRLAAVPPNKTTLPALSCVELRPCAAENALRLRVTDLDAFITVQIPATITAGDGTTNDDGVLVPFATFSRIVQGMKSGEQMSISCTHHQAVGVSCGRAKATLCGMPNEEMPKPPDVIAKQHVVDRKTLMHALRACLHAMSTDKTRAVLMSVCFDPSPALGADGLAVETAIMATDGRRAIIHRVPGELCKKKTVVPADGAAALLSFLESESAENIELRCNDAVIQAVTASGAVFEHRLLDGSYPDVRMVMPKRNEGTPVAFNRAAMIHAVEFCMVIHDDRRGDASVNLRCEDGRWFMSAEQAEIGDAKVELEASGTAGVNASFNSRYLLEALQAAPYDSVLIVFKTNASPILITGVGEDALQSETIMPLR